MCCSLGNLVRKVSQARAEVVIKTLCERAITALPKGKNEQQRDMAVIALKTVVGEVSGGNLAASAANMIANKMLEGVSKVRCVVGCVHSRMFMHGGWPGVGCVSA